MYITTTDFVNTYCTQYRVFTRLCQNSLYRVCIKKVPISQLPDFLYTTVQGVNKQVLVQGVFPDFVNTHCTRTGCE